MANARQKVSVRNRLVQLSGSVRRSMFSRLLRPIEDLTELREAVTRMEMGSRFQT
jgi:hypothetical protein